MHNCLGVNSADEKLIFVVAPRVNVCFSRIFKDNSHAVSSEWEMQCEEMQYMCQTLEQRRERLISERPTE